MAYYMRKMEKAYVDPSDILPSPIVPTVGRCSPNSQKEQEKRIRREIANSNERRRMQSINSGFQSLRTLLPNHDGEKLSKAAILQQTSDFIYRLEQEKTQLLNQVIHFKRIMRKYDREDSDSPSPKRRKRQDSMMDEGIGSPENFEDTNVDELKRELVDLRCQLDRERRYRMILEEQNRSLESQLYPEKLKELAQQIKLQEQRAYDERKILEQPPPQPRPVIMQYPIPPPQSHIISPATTLTTSRQNLETIVQAIRHLEGDKTTPGNTPQQTPSHTPTPEDEARKVREDEETLSGNEDTYRKEHSERSVIVDDQESMRNFSNRVTVELLHPIDRLKTRPSIIVS
ncbi:transcription factor AP-4-like [Patiria miniata]|uniref:BHLH domain-containing protein n=1 Tax=Patiria miniata TaxID=46514 RepID=A0A913ZU10_PATMI|nr:transcription factor AP-4-like [Patiria miniata]